MRHYITIDRYGCTIETYCDKEGVSMYVSDETPVSVVSFLVSCIVCALAWSFRHNLHFRLVNFISLSPKQILMYLRSFNTITNVDGGVCEHPRAARSYARDCFEEFSSGPSCNGGRPLRQWQVYIVQVVHKIIADIHL